jgi:hypothetical protein
MQLSSAPSKLPLPFASGSGTKTNPIPEASQIGVLAGAASLTDGFPPLCLTPIEAGGVPPSGNDMNGILFQATAIARWNNAGGGYPFDGTFASDTNVNGYPKGARVLRSDGLGYWYNTADNNTTNPETSASAAIAAGWLPDFTTGAADVTMTNANVTLTPLQYGQPRIIITGVLTASVNLIFPAIVGNWTVLNQTTGAYNITAKTAGGTGVVVTGAQEIVGDGTNIYDVSAIANALISTNNLSDVASQPTALTNLKVAPQIQTVSGSVATNALTVGYGGGALLFRNATLNSGTPVSAAVGSLSLVVPSGATLGTTSTVQAQLALLVAYNAGTPVLCIANVSGGVNLDETTLISPTTISSGATSASTIYSASTVASNSPFRVVGYITATEATAGTWATAPTLVQGAGGQAGTSLQSLGNGQTWANYSGSRTTSTTYYNITSKPIFVYVNAQNSANLQVIINGVSASAGVSNASQVPVSFIVPPGASYSITGPSTVGDWFELR